MSERIPYKRITFEELDDEGVLQLAGAIAHEAVEDYKLAWKQNYQISIDSCEKFFRSEYFHVLTGLSGDAIIRQARRDAMKEMEEENER